MSERTGEKTIKTLGASLRLNRREAMQGLGGALGAAWLSGSGALAFGAPDKDSDPLGGQSLYRDVVYYTGMGGHRTGSAVDMKTSEWLYGELKKAGFEADYLLCAPRRIFDLKRCTVEVGGMTYPGDPEWFPTATGPKPVKAPLAKLADGAPLESLKGKIWVLEDAKGGLALDNAIKEKVNQAGKAGALAAVVAINTASGELLGRSAPPERNEAPWCSIPLVGVAYKHKAALFAAAERGAEAAVIVDGEDKPGVRPRNAMGRIGKGKDLIVVTTPISALTQSGGERGPGVALFLGLARWLGKRQTKCRYIFSGNTGHETRGTGAYALLDILPPPKEVKAWLHMGATIANWNIAAPGQAALLTREAALRRGGTPSFAAAPELVPLLEKSFANLPDLKPRTDNLQGELAEYLRRGYRAYGFFGASKVFHTWGDDDKQTGPELLEPVGRALARSLELIEEM